MALKLLPTALENRWQQGIQHKNAHDTKTARNLAISQVSIENPCCEGM